MSYKDTESTEKRFVQNQDGAWASHAGVSESGSLANKLADSPVSESRIRSAIAPASETNTRDSLPVTRRDLGEAEIAVLFACYKEYFAPFWVGPLRKLAKKGVVIGAIAHDPVRDFVVGPVWWHRWSVRLGYSFVRDVFVHDDTPVDFGGKKPAGIRINQIPHGPYEVAEPKIGREEMRRRLGFSLDLTTEDTEGTEAEVRPCLDKPSSASESDSLASKLADSPVSESRTRAASIPASVLDSGHWSLDSTPEALDPRLSTAKHTLPVTRCPPLRLRRM